MLLRKRDRRVIRENPSPELPFAVAVMTVIHVRSVRPLGILSNVWPALQFSILLISLPPPSNSPPNSFKNQLRVHVQHI